MSLIRGILLAGKFRTQRELNAMSAGDQRNTLIVELSQRTNQPVAAFQAMNDFDLAGAGAALVFLREGKIQDDSALKATSADDQRNAVIVTIAEQTKRPIPELQGLRTMDLVLQALGHGQPAVTLLQPSYIRGVLLAGKFRTQRELNAMSAGDQRNTLIVELSQRTNQPVAAFQAMNDFDLAGAGAALVFLREGKIQDDSVLKATSADNQRNAVIITIAEQTKRPIPELQGLRTMDLVLQALGVDIASKVPRTMAEATAAILRHYPRVGGPTGPIGVPMDDVKRIPGGFMRAHSAGEIRFMDADIGPQGFHTKEASVRFVGFRCHQQSEGGPDEPYFIVGVQGYDSRNDPKPTTFGPFEGSEGVQTGDNRVLEEQLTTTTSPPFVIHVTAMENDSGDPAEASAALEKGMKDGAAKLTAALAPINPATVFAVGGAVQSFLAILGGPISDGLSALLGMGDDFIGQNSMQFFDYDRSKNEWLTPAPKDAPDFHTPHNVELVLDNGEGGRYSAFFQVNLFDIGRVPVPTEQ